MLPARVFGMTVSFPTQSRRHSPMRLSIPAQRCFRTFDSVGDGGGGTPVAGTTDVTDTAEFGWGGANRRGSRDDVVRDVLADPRRADAAEIIPAAAASRRPDREHREAGADGDEEPAHDRRIAQSRSKAALLYGTARPFAVRCSAAVRAASIAVDNIFT